LLPTLAEVIEEIRPLVIERGEVTVLYLSFGRFAKLEEVYGWEKLDAVLATAAAAVADCVRDERPANSAHVVRAALPNPNDEDVVCLDVPRAEQPGTRTALAAEADVTRLVKRLQLAVAGRVEAVHGSEISALVEVFAGRAHVTVTGTSRLERLVYRGVREAAAAARSVAHRERARQVAELRATLRDRAVYIEYDPIVVADTGAVFGYEALARGVERSLRSPEVMFAVAAEANLLWELSRLCRAKAFEGMRNRLAPNQLLFVNVDPHDFADPQFADEPAFLRDLRSTGGDGLHDPRQVVIEITERTAIKDYPALRERLRTFRARGYRFAVDDAGSGYAGLGSIANLEPDFIKLDISLITGIDTNLIKQNLVETMVRYANEQGARVIAEGVERAEELATVRSLGVHLVQGFYVNRAREAGGRRDRRDGDRKEGDRRDGDRKDGAEKTGTT
jgi:EAL domain-containing protein (putative c-di-GMP-specific phosphodiesterase class I)